MVDLWRYKLKHIRLVRVDIASAKIFKIPIFLYILFGLSFEDEHAIYITYLNCPENRIVYKGSFVLELRNVEDEFETNLRV